MSRDNKEPMMVAEKERNEKVGDTNGQRSENMFTLKKWKAVAMWSWDVECDTCAICRVELMGVSGYWHISNDLWLDKKCTLINPFVPRMAGILDACLGCQAEDKQDDCIVVWGECNHSFHNCCMSLWVQKCNKCPLCNQDWSIQKIGK